MRPSSATKPGGAPRPPAPPAPPDPRLNRDLATDSAELTALVSAACSSLERVGRPARRPLIPAAVSARLAEHRDQVVLATAIGVVFSFGVWIGAISPSALNASVLFLWTLLVVLYVVGRVFWEHLDHL